MPPWKSHPTDIEYAKHLCLKEDSAVLYWNLAFLSWLGGQLQLLGLIPRTYPHWLWMLAVIVQSGRAEGDNRVYSALSSSMDLNTLSLANLARLLPKFPVVLGTNQNLSVTILSFSHCPLLTLDLSWALTSWLLDSQVFACSLLPRICPLRISPPFHYIQASMILPAPPLFCSSSLGLCFDY